MAFPKTVSVQQIQRRYRTIFDQVMKNKEPLIVLNNNKAEVVIIEIHQFEEIQAKAERYDLEMAKLAVQSYQKEKSAGKLKKLNSLADLADEN